MAPANEDRRPGESDPVLLERARAGDEAAFETLRLRHVDAAREVAERVSTVEQAPDLVAEAFSRTLTAIRGGGGPDEAFRPYLLATVRRLAAGGPADAGPALAETDRDAAWAAWQSLPGDERDMLWRLVVHEQSPAALAPVLGTTPDGVAALARRAGERMRRAYLADLLTAAPEAGCRAARRHFARYARDTLAPEDRDGVDAHLDSCDRCREAAAGLVDVTELIRAGVGPHLLPGLFAADAGSADAGSADPDPAVGDSADDGRPSESDAEEGPADHVDAGSRAAGVAGDPGGGDDGHETAALTAAPVMTRAEAKRRASAAAGPRRLDVPLVLVGAAAVVAVATVAVLFWLFGGGTSPPHGTARPPTSATRPPPDGTLPPVPRIVAAPPLPTSQAVSTIRPVAVRAGTAVAPVSRTGTSTTTSTGARRVGTTRPSPTSRASRPAARPTRTSRPTPTPRPTRTRRPPPASVAPTPPTVAPGVAAVLGFEPSDDRRYTASLLAPPGWLVTSVRDVRGRHELEHVARPAQTFEGAMRPGPLVVEVTPWPGAVAGSLVTWFTDRTGALLPGSGSHPVP